MSVAIPPQAFERPFIFLYPEFDASPLDLADFYKDGHLNMRDARNSAVFSNVTCRFNRHSKTNSDKMVIFDIQPFLKDWLINYWTKHFFNLPLEEAVAAYHATTDDAIGVVPDVEIRKLWSLGYLPLRIKAIAEGSRVPMGTPFLTVKNTVPGFGWLAQYIETLSQTELWKGMTCATDSYAFKRMMDYWAERTSSMPEFTMWQGHDFSFRGMSGVFTAAKSSKAHLLNFFGTDTKVAIPEIKRSYNAKGFIGGSIIAQEHAIACEHIAINMHFLKMEKRDAEFEMVRHFIEDLFPTGMLGMIGDTLDFWRYITEYLPALKDKIMARTPCALGFNKVVVRPDSSPWYSNPYHVLTGFEVITADQIGQPSKDNKAILNADGTYSLVVKGQVTDTLLPEYEVKGLVEVLWDIFGGTENNGKGYKELDQHIGCIYGDSITFEIANKIFYRLEQKGFASTNVVLGIGSYFYQMNSRDSYGIAMKATAAEIDGMVLGLQKTPKTDPTKNSAIGYLRVELEDGKYVVYQNQTEEEAEGGELKEVFVDSRLTKDFTFDEVRANLAASHEPTWADYPAMALTA